MAKLTPELIAAWEKREGPVVFSTADGERTPNAIYATCAWLVNDEMIVVADNYFDKTKQNIESKSPGSILFLTTDRSSFQIKGTIAYHTNGPLFDHMKELNPAKHPGHGAAVITAVEAYKGAQRLL